MKHQAIEQLRSVAEVDQDYPKNMSRSQRLERWAELLEANPHRLLSTLHETEYQTAAVRQTMRGDDTPISIAFEDPVLRAAGMKDDSYGEAKRFFELTDNQLHEIICYCHYGSTVSAATTARAVRAELSGKRQGFYGRIGEFLAS
ncbi:MAG: hypothetical protein ACK4R3_05805 [Aliihoeflea sp.]